MEEILSSRDLVDIVKLLAICLDKSYPADREIARKAIIEILENKPVVVRDLDGKILNNPTGPLPGGER
jgi:hypothetical protein